MIRHCIAMCGSALVVMAALGSTSAQALTMQECSAKYKAAQTAGTLKGMKWNDYRKAECGTDASATPAAPAVATKPAAATKPATAPVLPAKPSATTTARPSVVPATPSNAVFPNAVSPKY